MSMSTASSAAPVSGERATVRRYTAGAIILHWTIALALFFQIAGGKWMVAAGSEADALVFAVFQLHKTVGLTILALTLARIIWRVAHPAPALPAGMKPWEHTVSKLTHYALYALMLVVPLSGWAMVSVSPTGVPTFFALIDALPFAHLPILADGSAEARHDLEMLIKQGHYWLSVATAGLIALHIAAALKHQFIARDDLIARMMFAVRCIPSVPTRKGAAIAAAAVASLFIAGGIGWGIAQKAPGAAAPSTELATTAPAGDWVLDPATSSLGFTITFSGNPVTARFENFSADIAFDPDNLEAAAATVIIDTTSVAIDNSTLQAQASGQDGFDLANFPTATWTATAWEALDDGTFRADGELTMRGVTAAVPLTFSFTEVDGVATVSGTATVDRLTFGVGAVGAANEAWLLHSVDIGFDLTATRP